MFRSTQQLLASSWQQRFYGGWCSSLLQWYFLLVSFYSIFKVMHSQVQNWYVTINSSTFFSCQSSYVGLTWGILLRLVFSQWELLPCEFFLTWKVFFFCGVMYYCVICKYLSYFYGCNARNLQWKIKMALCE